MNKTKASKAILRILYSLAIPVVIFVFFAIATGGRTASVRMFVTTLRQSVVPIIICWGLMLTMSLGMMNFSAGGMMVCAAIFGGNIAKATNTGVAGMVVCCVFITIIIGIFTGFLYNKMRVPCIVLTIGTMLVWESIPKWFYVEGVNMPAKYTYLAKSPYCFVIMAIMLILFYVIYNKTAFGHNMRAIGSNQSIANSVGLDSDKIKFRAFLLSSIFFGVAAILYISEKGEVRNISEMSSMMIMMDGFLGMFMAMFLSKYCDMTFAVVIGAFSMKMLSNGFVAMGLSSTVRDVVQGLLLLVLLTISANAGLLERRKANKAFAGQANEEYKNKQLQNS